MNIDCRPSLIAQGKLRHDPVREADFLLLPERVVKLNKTGAAILALCDGERTIREIQQELKLQFSVENIDNDVDSFLNRVVSHGWIELNCG
jgi:pyrroloquinoline quinone biosynthesis protein D